MVKETVAEIFAKDIKRLITELNSYTNEANIWKIDGEIKNSAGNLCLHLIGNLKYFVGNIIGGIEYERKRDAEFDTKDVPRGELVKNLEETAAVVAEALSKTDNEKLSQIYPIELFGYKMTAGYFMIHLTAHLNYHLGQVNYHRRLLDI